MSQTLNQFGDPIDQVELSPFGDPIETTPAPTKTVDLPTEDNPFQIVDKMVSENLFGEPVELPAPTSSMYSDVEGGAFSFSDRAAVEKKINDRYEMYRKHPDASMDFAGNLTYKGDIVPTPNVGFFTGDGGVGIDSKVGYGLKRAGKNVLELGGAGLEKLRDVVQENIGAVQVFDTEGNFSPDFLSPTELDQYYTENPEAGVFGGRDLGAVEYIQDNVSDINTDDSLGDTLITEGAGILTGGGAGVKAISWLPKLAQTKFVGNFAKMLGFEIGAASTMSSDVQTLAVGENSLLNDVTGGAWTEAMPFMAGMEINPDDPEYQQVLDKRFNILADAIAIMGPAETAVRGITAAAAFSWSMTGGQIFKALRPNTAQEMVVRDILDEFAGITGDPARDKEARERILKLVEENKQVFIDIPEEMGGNIEYTADTMSSIMRALENDDTEAARKLYTTAQGLLKKQVQQGRGSPELIEKVSTPGRELENVTNQTEEVLGGTDAINMSGDGFAAAGQKVIDDAEGVVTNLQTQLDEVNNQVGTLLREDPTFGEKIKQIENIVQFDIYAGRNQAADGIVTNLRRAYETMTDQKNSLYTAIKGGEINPNGLIEVLQDLQPGQISAAKEQLKPNSIFGRLLDEVQLSTKMVDGKPVQETAEEMQTRVLKFINDEGLDFQTLYREVRPAVAQNASDMFAQGNNAAGRVLREFVSYIDTKAVDDLIEFGDDEVAEAAVAAKEYYTKSYAPYWRDGLALEEVGNIHTQTVGRTSKDMVEEGVEIQGPKFAQESRQQVVGALSDTNREAGTQIINLLDKEGNAGVVTDYIIGDIMGKLSGRIGGSTKIPDIDTADIIESLSNYGTLVRENFPDQAKRIDTLLGNLRNSSLTREQLEAQIKSATDAATAAKEKIYGDELAAFFQPNGKAKINGFKAFEKILNDPQSMRKVPGTEQFEGPLADLIQTAKESGNPVLLEGMQVAYARHFRKKFLAATQELGGNRMLKTGVDTAVRDELDNVLLYGEAVFGDKPALINGLKVLLNETGIITRAKGAKSIGAGSDTYANILQAGAKQALDKSVTLTLGVLSRLGARVRAAGTGLITNAINKKGVAQVTDIMFADPDLFLEVARKVVDKDGNVSSTAAEIMKTYALRVGIYNEDNEPSDAEMLELLVDTERMFREGRDAVRQTGEALIEGATNK